MDLAALRAELADPRYAALVAAGDHVQLAALLNEPDATAPLISVAAPADIVAQALDAAELLLLTPDQRDVVRLLLVTPGDLTSAQILAIAAMFLTPGSATVARLRALARRQQRRAEVLGAVEPVDFSVVGAAIGPLAAQAPPNTAPSRTFARFIVQTGRIYLPALAGGTLDDGERVRFARSGFALDEASTGDLPPELLPGVTYHVRSPSGATFGVAGVPTDPPIFLGPGEGLAEFPGYTLKQVRR